MTVLVIGESCKDIFVYCDALRLAPDVPIPVLNVRNEIQNPGMAMNVKRNLDVLNLETEILTNENWENVTKTRFVHEDTNYPFLRVDTSHVIPPLLKAENLSGYEAIIISDYDKGFLSREVISEICQNHDLVFLDTKKVLGRWAQEAKFIKINNYEYTRSLPNLYPEIESKIIRTRGSKGADYQKVNYPVEPTEIRDSSGAGDAFMAAFVYNFLSSKNAEASVEFANKCASSVVKKRGVTEIEI